MKLKDAIQNVKSGDRPISEVSEEFLGKLPEAAAGSLSEKTLTVYADGVKMKVPQKVINTIEMFMRHKKQVVRIEGPLGDPIPKREFNVETVLSYLDRRGNIVSIHTKGYNRGAPGLTEISVPWDGDEIEVN